MFEGHLAYYLLENSTNKDAVVRFMERRGNYEEYFYHHIYEQSKVYANYLLDNGAKKNDVISIMMETEIDLICAFFGAQLIGAVPSMLYPPLILADLDSWAEKTTAMMNQTDSTILISDLKISSLFGSRFAKRQSITVLTKEEKDTGKDLFKLNISDYKETDICFLQFSSGTTGDQKPAIITHKSALTNARVMVKGSKIGDDGVKVVSWAPLYHDMGLVGAFISAVRFGGEITLIKPNDFLRKPYLWLKAISDHKATVTAGPNFSFGLCNKKVNLEKMEGIDLSSLKVALCGAEIVFEKTINEFYERFKSFGLNELAMTPVYGIAEATLGVSFSDPEEKALFKKFDQEELAKGRAVETSDGGIHLCSLGTSLETVSLTIKDDNDNELEDGRVGKVFIGGPSLFSGYYNDPIKSSEALVGTELDSGDEGFIYDGNLYLCGRIKDTIIIRGKNYYPTVFEEQLIEVDTLRKGRVIVSSIFDEKENTEQLVVFAEVKDKELLLEPKPIIAAIQKVLMGLGHKATYVELLEPGVLPKTTSGKLRRRVCVDMWKENKLVKKDVSDMKLLNHRIKFVFKLIDRKVLKRARRSV